jgi:hypothetical protein
MMSPFPVQGATASTYCAPWPMMAMPQQGGFSPWAHLYQPNYQQYGMFAPPASSNYDWATGRPLASAIQSNPTAVAAPVLSKKVYLERAQSMAAAPTPITKVGLAHVDMYSGVRQETRLNAIAHRASWIEQPNASSIAANRAGLSILSTSAWAMNFSQSREQLEHAKKLGDRAAVMTAKEEVVRSAGNMAQGLCYTIANICAIARRWTSSIGAKAVSKFNAAGIGLAAIHLGVGLKRRYETYSECKGLAQELEAKETLSAKKAHLEQKLVVPPPTSEQRAHFEGLANEAGEADVKKAGQALYEVAEKKKRVEGLTKLLGSELVGKIDGKQMYRIQDVEAALKKGSREALFKMGVSLVGIVMGIIEALVVGGVIAAGPLTLPIMAVCLGVFWLGVNLLNMEKGKLPIRAIGQLFAIGVMVLEVLVAAGTVVFLPAVALPLLGLSLRLMWLYYDGLVWKKQLESGQATQKDKTFIKWNMLVNGLAGAAAIALGPMTLPAIMISSVVVLMWFVMNAYAYKKIDDYSPFVPVKKTSQVEDNQDDAQVRDVLDVAGDLAN